MSTTLNGVLTKLFSARNNLDGAMLGSNINALINAVLDLTSAVEELTVIVEDMKR